MKQELFADQLTQESRSYIIQAYEAITGQNLYGHLPLKNAPRYQEAKSRAIQKAIMMGRLDIYQTLNSGTLS